MLTITYLNDAKQEKQVSYDNYDAYRQAQMACSIAISDYFPVTEVIYNNQKIDYTGTFGNLFFELDKQLKD